MEPQQSEIPEPPAELPHEVAEALTGYVRHLATTGVTHGLIGPREVPRLWERHVLQSAAIGEVVPRGYSVADVGAGAGLPGLALAVTRPDLSVRLIEPLERRTRWLEGVVADLQLPNVTVQQAKAEQAWDTVSVDVVTSRALASLPEVARLCLPLLDVGGRMVAMKGAGAEEELSTTRDVLRELGVDSSEVRTVAADIPWAATVVVATLGSNAKRITEPLGPGPAVTAAKKRAKAKERRRRG